VQRQAFAQAVSVSSPWDDDEELLASFAAEVAAAQTSTAGRQKKS
jgi:hypothetical protein